MRHSIDVEAVARVVAMLKDNDACGPGPVSEQEYHDDAKEIVRSVLAIVAGRLSDRYIDTSQGIVCSDFRKAIEVVERMAGRSV